MECDEVVGREARQGVTGGGGKAGGLGCDEQKGRCRQGQWQGPGVFDRAGWFWQELVVDRFSASSLSNSTKMYG
jgi:hypothetical protein